MPAIELNTINTKQASSPGWISAIAQRPWATLLAAVIVNGALFGTFLSIASICYESNDDTSLMQIAAGLETTEPSDRLVFTNVLIGHVLKWLFRVNRDVNWYTLYLLTTHFVAMTAILFAWLRLHCSTATVCTFCLLFIVFETRLLLQFQFTSTAIVAGWSGLLLLLAAETERPKHVRTFISLCGVGLVVVSAMIREQAFYFAVVVVMPLFIAQWFRHGIGRSLGWWAGAMLLAGLAMAYDHSVYASDEQWSDYVVYNKLRGRLQDYPVVDYTPNTWFFFRRVGWSENDYYAFRNYFADDREIASPHVLRRITEIFGSAGAIRPRWMNNLRERLDLIPSELLMTAANLLLALIIGCGSRLRVLRWTLLESLMIAGIFVYLAMYGKLEVRVMLPGVFFLNVLIFVQTRTPSGSATDAIRISHPSQGFRRILSMSFALVIIVGYCTSLFFVARNHAQLSEENRVNHAAFQYVSRPIRSEERRTAQSQPVYFLWKHDLPYLWDSPLSAMSELSDLEAIRLGWNIHSPHLAARLRRHSISDVYTAIFERSDLFLLCNEQDTRHLIELMREHFQEEVYSDTPRYYLYEHEQECGPRMVQIRQLRQAADSASRDE